MWQITSFLPYQLTFRNYFQPQWKIFFSSLLLLLLPIDSLYLCSIIESKKNLHLPVLPIIISTFFKFVHPLRSMKVYVLSFGMTLTLRYPSYHLFFIPKPNHFCTLMKLFAPLIFCTYQVFISFCIFFN
uniref:Uncharacterized protein n=1 Tax=Cacopsylla melanoneura TaxID=428564 RepID=A0A8D8Z034_9HEMI